LPSVPVRLPDGRVLYIQAVPITGRVRHHDSVLGHVV